MNPMTIQTGTPQETIELGRRLAALLRRGDVVALTGPLGAGKTQLARGLAAGLGADPRQVASPTFIMMSEYEADIPLVHIDAYRIHSLGDLETIGFTQELVDQSVTVIEWAERIEQDLPPDHLRVELSHRPHGREIRLLPMGLMEQRQGEIEEVISQLREEMAASQEQLSCRTCRKPIASSSPFFPFCSERCRLVDLNRWFGQQYSITRDVNLESND